MQHRKKRFEVKRAAPGKGLGLFATEPIKKGEFVIEYVGEKITTEQADKRKSRYLFEIDDDYALDGKSRDNIARYTNHACKSNMIAYVEGGKIHFYAKRTIKLGEELALNYGKEYFEQFIKPHGCKCASCSEA